MSALTEVTFRRLPAPRDDGEELEAEPWFSVGPDDVFPEEWPTFLFPAGRHRELFLETHPELVDPRWWAARQDDVRNEVMPDLFPYPDGLRFSVRYAERA